MMKIFRIFAFALGLLALRVSGSFLTAGSGYETGGVAIRTFAWSQAIDSLLIFGFFFAIFGHLRKYPYLYALAVLYLQEVLGILIVGVTTGEVALSGLWIAGLAIASFVVLIAVRVRRQLAKKKDGKS
jgi:hypothetical protein